MNDVITPSFEMNKKVITLVLHSPTNSTWKYVIEYNRVWIRGGTTYTILLAITYIVLHTRVGIY